MGAPQCSVPEGGGAVKGIALATRFNVLLVLLAVHGCSETTRVPDDTVGSSGAGGAANTGSNGGGGQVAPSGTGGGWTDCSSPEGYRICGGPKLCSYDPADCPLCSDMTPEGPDDLSVCYNEELAKELEGSCGYDCPDGKICVAYGSETAAIGSFSCTPYNLGVLYDQAGAPGFVRYADLGLWTGDPLPLPDSCPVIEGVTICGGNCGGCPTGQFCTGRSPLHPYSMCVPDELWDCNLEEYLCDKGLGCFIYTVEPEAQPLADRHGYCLPLDTCQKTAADLPGGGKCIAQ